MLGLELRPPGSRWTLLTDLIFVALEERGTAPGPAASRAEAEIDQLIGELTAAYALREDGRLDVLGGVRYWSLSTDLTVQGPMMDVSADESEDWLDPLVGVRSRLPLGERVDLLLRGDVGGFGLGSDFAYQLGAGLAWSLGERTELVVGYRHLDVDYDDGFEYDVATSGPLLGLVLGF